MRPELARKGTEKKGKRQQTGGMRLGSGTTPAGVAPIPPGNFRRCGSTFRIRAFVQGKRHLSISSQSPLPSMLSCVNGIHAHPHLPLKELHKPIRR